MSAGNVILVEETEAGSELVADAALGATTLTVDDPTDFQPDGGEALVGDEEVGYSTVVEETGVITLDAPLAAAWPAETRVVALPATVERYAHVVLEGDDEAMLARVPHALYDRIPVGVRDPDNDEVELVETARDLAGELVVTDVLERVPKIDGSLIDPESTIPPEATTDGVPPAVSPTPTLVPGIGSLFVEWVSVANADPVTYEVHASDTGGFTPDGSTLAGEVRGTRTVLRSMPGSSLPLDYATEVFVRLVAKDADGAAAPGTEASEFPAQVTGDDIAVNTVTADNILANTALFDLLTAVLIVSNTFRTGDSPDPRIELDAFDGFRLFLNATDAYVDFPLDGTPPAITAVLEALGLALSASTSSSSPADEDRVIWRDALGNIVAEVWGTKYGSGTAGVRLRATDPVNAWGAGLDANAADDEHGVYAWVKNPAKGTRDTLRIWDGSRSDLLMLAAGAVQSGGTNWGTDTALTNGLNSATKTVTHGLGATPQVVLVTPFNNVAAAADVTAKGATTFGVRVKHRDAGSNFGANCDFDWLAIA